MASEAVLRADWDTEVNGAAGRAGHGMHVYLFVHGLLHLFRHTYVCASGKEHEAIPRPLRPQPDA